MHLFQKPGKPCETAVSCRSDLRAGGGSSVWTVTCCSCEQISPKAAEPRSENRPSIQTHSPLLLLSQPAKPQCSCVQHGEQREKVRKLLHCLGSFKTCKQTVCNMYFKTPLEKTSIQKVCSYQTENIYVYKISVLLNLKMAEAEGQLMCAHFMMLRDPSHVCASRFTNPPFKLSQINYHFSAPHQFKCFQDLKLLHHWFTTTYWK